MLHFLKLINHFLWNGPILFLLMGTHIFFSIRLRWIQKKVWKGIRYSFSSEPGSQKNFSSYSALATTLAATLGTGNIIGVSTAIALGGPGALLWCWLTGILGMATTYAECFLSSLYRQKQSTGDTFGGPMYVLEKGLGSKKLGVIYAICTVLASFGVGGITQANAITETACTLWHINSSFSSLLLVLFLGLVLIGGTFLIQKVCQGLVPIVSLFYIGSCLVLLFQNHSYIIPAIGLVLENAFRPQCLFSGISGGGIILATRYGIARGLFTNEAGIGSAGIAAAISSNTTPQKQGLVSMTATFWDTVVMCLITALVILTHLLRFPNAAADVSVTHLTHLAFSTLPYGEYLLGISLILFALTTLIGWSYFGKTAIKYIFPNSQKKFYEAFYLVMIFVGGIASLQLVWEAADFLNALMIIPNLISLYLLRDKIFHNQML